MREILYYPSHRARLRNPSRTQGILMNSRPHAGDQTRIYWNVLTAVRAAYILRQSTLRGR